MALLAVVIAACGRDGASAPDGSTNGPVSDAGTDASTSPGDASPLDAARPNSSTDPFPPGPDEFHCSCSGDVDVTSCWELETCDDVSDDQLRRDTCEPACEAEGEFYVNTTSCLLETGCG
jgi:hypothetical protein